MVREKDRIPGVQSAAGVFSCVLSEDLYHALPALSGKTEYHSADSVSCRRLRFSGSAGWPYREGFSCGSGFLAVLLSAVIASVLLRIASSLEFAPDEGKKGKADS